MRIGHGYDAHVFSDACPLVLGGVTIPCEKGLLAHSDGDVVVHALCDALLGAMALGDMGFLFPNTANEFKHINSRILLRKVMQLVQDKGYQVVNVDITIVAEVPKLAPHIQAMRKHLAADMQVAMGAVNVKSTTTEGLGFVGRQEGIATHAVALIQ